MGVRLSNGGTSSVLRHILVDTLGLLLGVVVHPANVQDRDGAYYPALQGADALRPIRAGGGIRSSCPKCAAIAWLAVGVGTSQAT
jgi:hypothetical protein